MKCPDKSTNEPERLRALAEYRLGPDHGLPALDPIVDMATKLFDCPSAAVNMIGDEHVFLASSLGIGEADLRRSVSFCAHAINQDEVMVVEDAALDPRFHDNPIVEAGMIRFYAGVPLKSPEGHALGALCVIDSQPRPVFSREDRTRLKELSRLVLDRLETRRLNVASDSPSRFEVSARTSPNPVLCVDQHARITAWNAAATQLFGHAESEMIGAPIDLLIAPDDRAHVHAVIDRARAGDAPPNSGRVLTGVKQTGETFPATLDWSCWDEKGVVHFGAIVRDLSDERRERDTLYRLANYDTLTGLPNRNLLRTRMEEAFAEGQAMTLILADLKGFGDINNTLGHAVGDEVLTAVGQRIGGTAPAQSLVARMGSDQYAILIAGNDPIQADTTARSVVAAVARPMVVDGHEVRLAAHCGIAVTTDSGDTVETLISGAGLALGQSRLQGRGSVCLFTPALRAKAVARRMYDAELHRAFDRDEFTLFYQPQVNLGDGTLVGAEALIRWQHPERGLLAPAAFLPALEAGPLAAAVGQWALETACAQAMRWRRAAPSFHMSVNLSAAQFRNGDLPRRVRDALNVSGLSPERLELEITENIILTEQDHVLAQIEALHQLGIALSFDDFGTGFASLNLLRSFPISQIKIDKGFTQLIQTSEKDRSIIAGLIGMAHDLNLKVVAEGVEHELDRDFLRAHGCEKGQGYLFGRPVPAEVFTERFLDGAAAVSTLQPRRASRWGD